MGGDGTKSTDRVFDLNQERRPYLLRGDWKDAYVGKFVSLAGENSWISSLVASVSSVTQ